MSNANIGWLFYKDYFNGIDYADLGCESNKMLIQAKVTNIISQSVTIEEEEMLGNAHFKATTTYPGLILGSGNAHELPSIEGQVILGFHFDYTSGLPVIQGSSIKGVLRSAFAHEAYIREILDDETVDVEALASEIFDNGDVFFDATIISEGKILGDDYLTPHDAEGFKDPIPLRFIKILPHVTFRFDFDIASDKNKKVDLFRTILEDLGLGAKTNVGYGKFTNFTKIQTPEELELERKEREEKSFNEALKSEDLEKLEAFKRDFPNSQRDVESAILKIKENKRVSHIKTAYENLVKTNKTYVKKFVDKYEGDPDANEYVEKAQALFKNEDEPDSNKKSSDLTLLDAEFKDASALKIVLQKLETSVLSSEEGRAVVKEAVIRVYKTQKGKKEKKFFSTIQLSNFIDSDFDKIVQSSAKSST